MVQQERSALFSSAEFEQMVGLLQRGAGGVSHPKLPETVRLLQEHFGRHGEQTRVMVFCTYRYGVFELIEWLRRVDGVRASHFIGQSAGKGDDEKGTGAAHSAHASCGYLECSMH